MELRRLEVYRVKMKLKNPFETSFGKTVYRYALIIRLIGEGGEEGWGEVVADRTPSYSYETVNTAEHIIRDFIAPVLDKVEEPEDIIRETNWIRGHNMAKAGVEMALWDLKAKLESKPLSELIGGIRSKILSGVSIGIQENIEKLLKRVEFFISTGYKRIKIKIKPGWDIKPVKELRKEYPDILLQVDANAAYTIKDADHLKKLDEYNLLMIEQPLHYDDLYFHSILQKLLKTPVCLDESIKSLEHLKAAISLGSCKIVNVKPGRVGGILSSLKILETCKENNLGAWIGGMLETGIGRGHLVALASHPAVNYYNDISASDRYYEEDIVEPPWTLNPDSTISVPKSPGIGVEVNLHKLLKYTDKMFTCNITTS